MPGHEKKGASQGEDPDPAPYLFLTFQMKREDMTKPYDAKKSFWVPDGEGGFVEGQLESENGAKVSLNILLILGKMMFLMLLNKFQGKDLH